MDSDTLLFFDGKPKALEIYLALCEQLEARFDLLRYKLSKSQISFYNRRLFACVSFARVKRKAELPPEYLVLTLGLPGPLESPRIAVRTEPYPGRWTHHIVLSSPEELDEELMGWLRQAYDFSMIK